MCLSHKGDLAVILGRNGLGGNLHQDSQLKEPL